MSSTYSAICLSHDPGIVLGPDLTYDQANGLNSRDRLAGHETCDIVIGRYSYPLVEAACLGTQLPGPSGCNGHHSNVGWIDRDWLRLLSAVSSPSNQTPAAVVSPLLGRCWTPVRLHRLRDELGTPQPTAPQAAAPPPSTASIGSAHLCPAVLGLNEPNPDGTDTDFTRLHSCTVRGPHFQHVAADDTRWIHQEIVPSELTYTFSRGAAPIETETVRRFPPAAAPNA